MDATRCRGKGDCQDGEICITHHLWQDLSGQIHSFLNAITLADLVRRGDIRAVCERQDSRYAEQQILCSDLQESRV